MLNIEKNKSNPTLFTVSGFLSLDSSGILTRNLEASANWEWVGSLLTVGTNVKIRGLASESPEETYETCNKLDFQSYWKCILTFFSTNHDIYLTYFDKLPIALWWCVWLPMTAAIKIVIVYQTLFLWYHLSVKAIQPQKDPVVRDSNKT